MNKIKRTRKKQSHKELIDAIESAAKAETAKKYIKDIDYSVVLPKNLRRRVKKIIQYDFDNFDKNVYHKPKDLGVNQRPSEDFEDEDDNDSYAVERRRQRQAVKDENFNESTCSDVERLEHEFPKFELKLDDDVGQYIKHKRSSKHWFTKYLCKKRRDRIIWHSKIHESQGTFKKKTVDQQAEDLMDASAERFVDWLNAMGSDPNDYMSKADLKDLFSIEPDQKLLSSIIIEPKEVHAIAKTVADKWNLQKMAIELKFENYIKNRLENVPKQSQIKVAFGYTVPAKDRAWIPTDRDQPIETVFPADILSGERLFKGITHLRTTKGYVDFCHRHPDAPRPQYLIDEGIFDDKAKSSSKIDLPLYELLKLKY